MRTFQKRGYIKITCLRIRIVRREFVTVQNQLLHLRLALAISVRIAGLKRLENYPRIYPYAKCLYHSLLYCVLQILERNRFSLILLTFVSIAKRIEQL